LGPISPGPKEKDSFGLIQVDSFAQYCLKKCLCEPRCASGAKNVGERSFGGEERSLRMTNVCLGEKK
jgi:hypothetical protein